MSKETNKFVVVEYSPSYPEGAICTDSYRFDVETREAAEREVELYKEAAKNMGFLHEVEYVIFEADKVPDGVV